MAGHALRLWPAATLALALTACTPSAPAPLEGRPGGPYRMTLAFDPAPPAAGRETRLTTRLTRAASGAPVQNLQVVHERVVHNFIVALDFSSFAHIHHEDFDALRDDDLRAATFSFPYTFPRAGHYRMVSEFTHRDRGWIKHFDVNVGDAPTPRVTLDPAREKRFGAYTATLSTSPPTPVAGFETELVLQLARDGEPVTDLALILGSEVHVALWRIDGRHFGHAHTWTPHMAAMMAEMHDRELAAEERAARMAGMMAAMAGMPAEQVFHGPRIPVHHVFPEPGVYAIFLQCAPGGSPRVFDFQLEVERYREGMETRIDSMVTRAAHGMP